MGKLIDWFLGIFGLVRISTMKAAISSSNNDIAQAVTALEAEESAHENTLKERDIYHDWNERGNRL